MKPPWSICLFLAGASCLFAPSQCQFLFKQHKASRLRRQAKKSMYLIWISGWNLSNWKKISNKWRHIAGGGGLHILPNPIWQVQLSRRICILLCFFLTGRFESCFYLALGKSVQARLPSGSSGAQAQLFCLSTHSSRGSSFACRVMLVSVGKQKGLVVVYPFAWTQQELRWSSHKHRLGSWRAHALSEPSAVRLKSLHLLAFNTSQLYWGCPSSPLLLPLAPLFPSLLSFPLSLLFFSWDNWSAVRASS